MRPTFRFAALAVLFLLQTLLPARADVTITEEGSRIDGSEAATMRIYLTGNRVRVDNIEADATQAMIFDAGKETLRMIDYNSRAYVELDREDLERLARQMNALSAQMAELREQIQAQLQGLPEDERRIAEKALEAQFPPGTPAAAPRIVYTLTAADEPVGAWSADRYSGTQDGTKIWDIWTIGWDEAGLTPQDFAVFEQLGDIMESMAAQDSDANDFIQLGDPGEEGDYSGIPVRRVSYEENGDPDMQFEITEISRGPVDPTLFTLPDGFTQETMPGL
jgi:hypothetical protein